MSRKSIYFPLLVLLESQDPTAGQLLEAAGLSDAQPHDGLVVEFAYGHDHMPHIGVFLDVFVGDDLLYQSSTGILGERVDLDTQLYRIYQLYVLAEQWGVERVSWS